MFVKINARNNIVEAADTPYGDGYIEVVGTVEENMPLGLLGFNGRVYTPNYSLIGGNVVARTAAEMARDPYSDEDAPRQQERLDALEAAMLGVILGGGGL